jgi:hypothetical protein
MGGPTDEADGGESSAVARKCSTLLGLAVLINCSDDADPAAPAASSSSLDGKKVEEPSMVLCGSVPGLEVIGSSDDGSNSSSSSSEDEVSASCRVSADAESATAAASSSELD